MTAPVIGLTGGIATGKSTVATMLTELGAVVLDADAIVHELQAPGTPLLEEIERTFGPDVLDAQGALDRAALGRLVFADEEARRRLNQLVHPRVGAEMARRLQQALASDAPLVVLDIPLLLENRKPGGSGVSQMQFAAIVLVYAPAELQLARQLARNDYGEREARRRMDAQLPIEDKRALADHVIDNGGSLAATRSQVEALFRKLTGH